MALGNVFIKDVDGNIPYDTGSSGEKVTGLLFDVSLQPTLFTEGYGKTNETRLKPGDVCYITSFKSAVNDWYAQKHFLGMLVWTFSLRSVELSRPKVSRRLIVS